jgi:hypothetical protein
MIIFWFIYLFIYNNLNGLNLDMNYDETSKNCGPKTGIFSEILKIINKYIFPNFLFFIMLILVIFNIYYSFNHKTVYNTGIKHIMIGFSMLLLLGLILFVIYSFSFRNKSNTGNKVPYDPNYEAANIENMLSTKLNSIKVDIEPTPAFTIPSPAVINDTSPIVEKKEETNSSFNRNPIESFIPTPTSIFPKSVSSIEKDKSNNMLNIASNFKIPVITGK